MPVKYETEIYEFLKDRRLTCVQISNETGYAYHRVWTALTQLEQKELVSVDNNHWKRNDSEEDLRS